MAKRAKNAVFYTKNHQKTGGLHPCSRDGVTASFEDGESSSFTINVNPGPTFTFHSFAKVADKVKPDSIIFLSKIVISDVFWHKGWFL